MKHAALSTCCQAPLRKVEGDYIICLNCYEAKEDLSNLFGTEQEPSPIPDLSWKMVFILLFFLLLLRALWIDLL